MRTLSSNVSGGIGGNSTPVLLVKITAGAFTLPFASLDTAEWEGLNWVDPDRYYGGVTFGAGDMAVSCDLFRNNGSARLGNFTIELVNPQYFGSNQSMIDSLSAANMTLQGARLEARLIFQAPGGSWDNADLLGAGIVSEIKYTAEKVTLSVLTETESSYPNTGNVDVSEENFPDIYAGGSYPEQINQVVKIVYGWVNSVKAYLVNSTAGSQVYQVANPGHRIQNAGALYDKTGVEIYSEIQSPTTADNESISLDGRAQAACSDPLESFELPYILWSRLYPTASGVWVDDANWVDKYYTTAATLAHAGITQDETFTEDFTAVTGGVDLSSKTYLDAEDELLGYSVHLTMKKTTGTGNWLDTGGYGIWWAVVTNVAGTPLIAIDPPLTISGQYDTDGFYNTLVFNDMVYVTRLDFPTMLDDTDWITDFDGRLRMIQPSLTSSEGRMCSIDLLASKRIGDADVYSVDVSGRLCEDSGTAACWTDGVGTRSVTKTQNKFIENPAEIVEGILRHEGGYGTSIDMTKFDEAHGNLRYYATDGDASVGWEAGGVIEAETNVRQLAAKVCAQSGMVLFDGHGGSIAARFITNGRVASLAFDTSTIKKDSLKSVSSNRITEIYDRFVLNYAFDTRTGAYTKQLVMDKDQGIAVGDEWRYMQDACQDAYDMIQKTKTNTINLDWVSDDNTARKMLDHAIWLRSRDCRFVEFEAAGLISEGLELLDVITVKHPLTSMNGVGWPMIVYGITVNWKRKSHTIKAAYIPAFSRSNGSPE